MAASVRIEDEAFSDERYEDLATAAGLADSDHARGKMAKLWRQCTLEAAYTLPNQMVLRVLGPRGIEALEVARLGVRVGSDRVRIRGTRGRIEWLRKLRENGKKGGRPRKVADEATRKPIGSPSGLAEPNPPAPAPAPAPAPIDQDLDQQPRGEGDAASRPAKKPRPVKASLPEGWKPERERLNHDAEQRARARGVDIADAFGRLVEWAKAGDERKADWNACWRYWLRGEKPTTNRSNSNPSRVALDELHRLEREEQLQ